MRGPGLVSDLRLKSSKQLLLDTSALIYFLTAAQPYFAVLEPVFRRVQRGEATVLVSAMSEAELLVRPYKMRSTEAVERIQDFLSEPGIVVAGVDRRTARRAGRIRAAVGGIGLPDAIIMAAALETGCDAVVGNDHAWKKLQELPFVCLDDII